MLVLQWRAATIPATSSISFMVTPGGGRQRVPSQGRIWEKVTPGLLRPLHDQSYTEGSGERLNPSCRKPWYQHKGSHQGYHQGDILPDLGLKFRPALALPNFSEQTSALQGKVSPTVLLLGNSPEPHCCLAFSLRMQLGEEWHSASSQPLPNTPLPRLTPQAPALPCPPGRRRALPAKRTSLQQIAVIAHWVYNPRFAI